MKIITNFTRLLTANCGRRARLKSRVRVLLLRLVLLPLLLFAMAPLANAQIASGWWYNPAEGGRGYFIEQQGSTLFTAAFLYDTSGRASWFGSTGTLNGMSYQGALTAYANGQTLTGAFKAPALTPSPGNVTIVFSDATHATLTWPEGSIPIQRFPIVPGGVGSVPPTGSPMTGWFWNPAEGGRGFAFEVQNGTLLFAGFMYDSNGNPIWYASQGPMSSLNLYQGQWVQYANGQTLLGSFQSASVINPQVGALTLQFTNPSNATMTLPQGAQVPLTHFLFSQYGAPPPPAGAEPAQITVAPTLLSFAMQAMGTASAPQTLTLANTGGATAQLLYSMSGSNPGDFVTFGTCSYGMILASGASCALNVIFTPIASGARSAAISVQASATDIVQTVGISGGASPSSSADVARFLNQSTFGPTTAMLGYVQNKGVAAFIEEQFAAPPSGYGGFPYYPQSPAANCVSDGSNPPSASSLCFRDNYSLYQVQLRLFQNAMTSPDQLRQRVAWALSQILVTSGVEVTMAYAMANYQQIMVDNAFGNFRDILYQATLSPMMGDYLNMVNNDKANAAAGTSPNENYAREILQLFSIGLNQLNLDGSVVVDSNGAAVPTYSQSTITAFAATFTGWTYAALPGIASKSHNPINYSVPMVATAANHDVTTKALFSSYTIPAGQTADVEMNEAIDNIFNHPNVGPFIGKQLIQKLVTSNPSPAYVTRVSQAFNNNGQGVRGDMKATLRAILLDPEARGDFKSDPAYGHMREPVLFITSVLRALDGESDGVYLMGQSNSMQQQVLFSPTVFNYYPADYSIPGTTLLGPEFGIQNATTSFARASFLNSLLFGAAIKPDATVTGSIGTSVSLSNLQALGDSNPTQMIELLNTLMFAGNMSAAMKNAILTAVLAVPLNAGPTRARTAAYLAAMSPQFQVIQ